MELKDLVELRQIGLSLVDKTTELIKKEVEGGKVSEDTLFDLLHNSFKKLTPVKETKKKEQKVKKEQNIEKVFNTNTLTGAIQEILTKTNPDTEFDINTIDETVKSFFPNLEFNKSSIQKILSRLKDKQILIRVRSGFYKANTNPIIEKAKKPKEETTKVIVPTTIRDKVLKLMPESNVAIDVQMIFEKLKKHYPNKKYSINSLYPQLTFLVQDNLLKRIKAGLYARVKA